jgi:Protein of unknown function (DUF3995)
MSILAIGVFIVLTAIAALHASWAFGSHWPAANERDLVALAIGATGRKRMPAAAQCAIAALAIFASGCVALLLAGVVRLPLPGLAITIAGYAIAAVFIGRGIAGYVPVWRALFSQRPFARNDVMYYSPLCLGVAAAMLILVVYR